MNVQKKKLSREFTELFQKKSQHATMKIPGINESDSSSSQSESETEDVIAIPTTTTTTTSSVTTAAAAATSVSVKGKKIKMFETEEEYVPRCAWGGNVKNFTTYIPKSTSSSQVKNKDDNNGNNDDEDTINNDNIDEYRSQTPPSRILGTYGKNVIIPTSPPLPANFIKGIYLYIYICI